MEIKTETTQKNIEKLTSAFQRMKISSEDEEPDKVPSTKSIVPLQRQYIYTVERDSDENSMPTCFSYNVFLSQTLKQFYKKRNRVAASPVDQLHLPSLVCPLLKRVITVQIPSFNLIIVEPHEIQFQEYFNSKYGTEGKSIFSSYFKEQQILPSSVDCPLIFTAGRKLRESGAETGLTLPIISPLQEIPSSIDWPFSKKVTYKPGRQLRESGTQTELTLPIILPLQLEKAVRPYFKVQTNNDNELNVNNDLQESNCSSSDENSNDSEEFLVREPFFDSKNIQVIDDNETNACTAANVNAANSSFTASTPMAFMGKPPDSSNQTLLDLTLDSLSSQSSDDIGAEVERNCKIRIWLTDQGEDGISPIHPPFHGNLAERASINSSTHSIFGRQTNHLEEKENVSVDDLTFPKEEKYKFKLNCSLSSLPCDEFADNSTGRKFSKKVTKDNTIGDETPEDKYSSNPGTSHSKRGRKSRQNLLGSFSRGWSSQLNDDIDRYREQAVSSAVPNESALKDQPAKSPLTTNALNIRNKITADNSLACNRNEITSTSGFMNIKHTEHSSGDAAN